MPITNACAGVKIDRRKKLHPQIAEIVRRARQDAYHAMCANSQYGNGISDGIYRLVIKLEDIGLVLEKKNI